MKTEIREDESLKAQLERIKRFKELAKKNGEK